jgi:hypothetical protein
MNGILHHHCCHGTGEANRKAQQVKNGLLFSKDRLELSYFPRYQRIQP